MKAKLRIVHKTHAFITTTKLYILNLQTQTDTSKLSTNTSLNQQTANETLKKKLRICIHYTIVVYCDFSLSLQFTLILQNCLT